MGEPKDSGDSRGMTALLRWYLTRLERTPWLTLAFSFAGGLILLAVLNTLAPSPPSKGANQPPASSVGHTLTTEERGYLDQLTPILRRQAGVWKREMHLYRNCVSACSSQDRSELIQNIDTAQNNLRSAKNTLKPPKGYEQSNQAFISLISMTADTVQRLASVDLGPDEGVDIANKSAALHRQARDLVPSQDARAYYDKQMASGSTGSAPPAKS